MSIALANRVRDLETQVDALTALVRALAAELDALKEKKNAKRG